MVTAATIKLKLGSCPSGPTAGTMSQQWRAVDGTLIMTFAYPADRYGGVKRVDVSIWCRDGSTITARKFVGSDSAARAEAWLNTREAVEVDDWTVQFHLPSHGQTWQNVDTAARAMHIVAAYDAARIHTNASFIAGATFGGYGLHGGHHWTSRVQPVRMRLYYTSEHEAREAAIAASIAMGCYETIMAHRPDASGRWYIDVSLLRHPIGATHWNASLTHPCADTLIAWAGERPIRMHYDLGIVPGPWNFMGTRDEIDAYASLYEAAHVMPNPIVSTDEWYATWKESRDRDEREKFARANPLSKRIVGGTRHRRNARRRVNR